MKTNLYLLVLLICSASLLKAQHSPILPGVRSALTRPSADGSLERPERIDHARNLSHANRAANLRSMAIEQMDSLVVDGQQKGEFYYDDYGYPMRYTLYYKESPFGDWLPGFQEEYVFSPDGAVLEEKYANWSDDLNDWEYGYHDVYTYLPNGNLDEIISYDWDQVTMDWVNGWRTEYSYLPDNRIDREDYQQWNPGNQSWHTHEQLVYYYDAMDRLKEEIYHTYNFLDGDFDPRYRVAYGYNSESLIEVFTNSYWNQTSNFWEPDSRTTYVYNSLGERIQTTDSYYDLGTMVWYPASRENLEYDSYGNMIRTTFSGWDFGINMFIPEDRREFEYDVNTPVEDIYFPHIWVNEFIFKHKMLLITVSDYNNGVWEEEFHGDFYYSPIMTSIDNEWDQNVHIYPNPANDHLVLQLPSTLTDGEVSLLHVSGTLVLNQAISGVQTMLSISDIPAGMYILQYRSRQQGVVSRPLLIHR